jgi:hypothetical protein
MPTIRQVDFSWDSPYNFEVSTEIEILHKRLRGVSILLLVNSRFCFELRANLFRCQIFFGVRYFAHSYLKRESYTSTMGTPRKSQHRRHWVKRVSPPIIFIDSVRKVNLKVLLRRADSIHSFWLARLQIDIILCIVSVPRSPDTNETLLIGMAGQKEIKTHSRIKLFKLIPIIVFLHSGMITDVPYISIESKNIHGQ